MTPERLAALEAEAARAEAAADNGLKPLDLSTPEPTIRLDESVSPVAGRRFKRTA
jgi:hypothetical protein